MRRPFLAIAIPIIIGLIIMKSSVSNNMALGPSTTMPWADAPMKLVTTPQYATKKTDIFTKGATHMALLHNAILRGYNSIYQQAPYIEPSENYNFIGYCLTWYKFVKSHHDDEEGILFVQVEQLLNDKTIWTETHKEHRK